MINDLVVIPKQGSLSMEVTELVEQAEKFQEASISLNTRKAYEDDWHHWVSWCQARGVQPAPADPRAVALYLTDCVMTGYTDRSGRRRDYTAATLRRRLSGISVALQAQGHEPLSTRTGPLHRVWQGIVKTIGTEPNQASPLLTEHIRRMVAALPVPPKEEIERIADDDRRRIEAGKRLRHIRDRAILLLGYGGALRRSEVAGLTCSDIRFERDGLRVTIRGSKTDKERTGQTIGVVYGSDHDTCPVRAVQDWLRESGITAGYLFRHIDNAGRIHDGRMDGGSIARIIKRTARAAGIELEGIRGHSLRAGYATQAAMNGAQERIIMKTTRHQSLEMLRRYIRDGELFRENAGKFLGL